MENNMTHVNKALNRAQRFIITIAVVMTWAASVCAQNTSQSGATLDEQVITIPQPGAIFNINLEATLFKPPGAGPFPLAIINHGKAYGDPKFQGRYRPFSAARFFLQRGYVVLVPMRQGFSKSGGLYIGAGCNVESNGRTQAQDVLSALKFMGQQNYVDVTRVIVLGQSHGGWTTLALGASSPPAGIKGLVNFAGGLRQESCAGWQNSLMRAAGGLGADTKLPTLWFYGDNDSYFAPPVWRGMHKAFVEAGGNARLVAFGEFSGDAHSMFGSRIGEPIWQPEVGKFLQEIGLPSDVRYPEFAPRQVMAAPPRSNFAQLDEVAKVPFLSDEARQTYLRFIQQLSPRAFSISPSGAYGWASGGDDPLFRSLENCNKRGAGACKLYAVDDAVVWVP